MAKCTAVVMVSAVGWDTTTNSLEWFVVLHISHAHNFALIKHSMLVDPTTILFKLLAGFATSLLCLCLLILLLTLFIFAKCERSEHWRRLRDWLFCSSFCVCVYMMTHHLHMSHTSRHQDRQDVLMSAHIISCSCKGRCSSSRSSCNV